MARVRVRWRCAGIGRRVRVTSDEPCVDLDLPICAGAHTPPSLSRNLANAEE